MSNSMGVHYSSSSDEWETPKEFFSKLNKEFSFEVDLCATKENSKCLLYSNNIEEYVRDLDVKGKFYWINPPYSRGLQYKCIKAAKELADKGNVVVCLIPSRTDTNLWHDFIWDKEKHTTYEGAELRSIKGRLKFEKNGKPLLDKKGKPQSAPFPSAVVVFSGGFLKRGN